MSTKINAEVVGLKRQVAAGLDALGRNMQTDLSEEVRKGASEVAGSIKEDMQQMEGRLSRKVSVRIRGSLSKCAIVGSVATLCSNS